MKLTDEHNSVITHTEGIKALGQPVGGLIPCLDPDLEPSAYKDSDLMRKRVYDHDPKCIMYKDDEVVANELTEKCPFFVDFVPSADVMNRLYRRMAQIREPMPALWAGFTVS